MQGLPHIVLVASARTGTHLLRDIIAASGRYRNADEIFLPPERTYPPHLPYNFWHRTAGFAPVAGEANQAAGRLAYYLKAALAGQPDVRLCMDVKYYHQPLLDPGADEPEAAAIRAFAGQGCQFIHLTRRNLLAQLVSVVRAELTQEWVRDRGPQSHSEAVAVELDPEMVLPRLHRMVDERARMARLLAPFAPLDLAYEDLVEGEHPAPALISTLRASFSCEVPHDYVPRFVKIGRPLREMIANLGAVEKALNGSPYAAFLPG